MNLFLLLSLGLAMISVIGIMGLGLYSMARGGEFNQKYGNKLMQARVALQGLALGLLALAYFVSKT